MERTQEHSIQRDQQREELLSALQGRADFYSLIASLFFRPLTQAQIDGVAEADLSSFAGLNEEFDRGVNDIARALRKRNTGTREQLATDYTGAFVGTKTYEMKNAVPFESVFTSEEGLLCRESFHEVRAMFRKAAFKVREDDALPDDHLGYLCEFVSALTRRAAESLRDGRRDDAVRDLEDADR